MRDEKLKDSSWEGVSRGHIAHKLGAAQSMDCGEETRVSENCLVEVLPDRKL